MGGHFPPERRQFASASLYILLLCPDVNYRFLNCSLIKEYLKPSVIVHDTLSKQIVSDISPMPPLSPYLSSKEISLLFPYIYVLLCSNLFRKVYEIYIKNERTKDYFGSVHFSVQLHGIRLSKFG